MLYTILLIIFILIFPWKKAFSWLSKYADLRLLSTGILMISIRFIFNFVNRGAEDGDLYNQAKINHGPIGNMENMLDAFVPVFGWVLFAAGLVLVVLAIGIARERMNEKVDSPSNGRD